MSNDKAVCCVDRTSAFLNTKKKKKPTNYCVEKICKKKAQDSNNEMLLNAFVCLALNKMGLLEYKGVILHCTNI